MEQTVKRHLSDAVGWVMAEGAGSDAPRPRDPPISISARLPKPFRPAHQPAGIDDLQMTRCVWLCARQNLCIVRVRTTIGRHWHGRLRRH